MADLILRLGDQLFSDLSDLPAGVPILMREDWELCTRTKHHKQKIAFFLSAMRHHAAWLSEQGREVVYQELEPGVEGSFAQAVAEECERRGVSRLWLHQPHDAFLLPALQAALKGVEFRILPTQGFLTSQSDWDQYRHGRKRLLMGDFYVEQRRRLGLLVNDLGEPDGGRWSFDTENRKSLPKGVIVPWVPRYSPDSVTQEVLALVSQHFADHPGNLELFDWPVTYPEAREALTHFLHHRLELFGPYEDAVSKDHRLLWHSLLSPLLNCGLLTPRQVVAELMSVEAPIESKEGFLRQVIGWREFIYFIELEYRSTGLAGQNSLGNQRRLTSAWYEGTTGLPPLDTVIRRASDHAWCHHIERLMIAGSAMLMADVHPEESYNWFMEMFIDSADWVMRPNVFGMSQFADGGFFATKPYVSGSAYLRKMTDFPPGPWCDIWDGLYWRFIDRHQDRWVKNHRMSMMVRQLDKMPSEKRERLFKIAEDWIESVTTA